MTVLGRPGRRVAQPSRHALGLAPLRLLEEAEAAGEHVATFLGLPLWIWEIANLLLFLGLLLYFVARPLAAAFRQRQVEVERRLKEAQRQRAEAARLEAEVHERLDRLTREIDEIRARGIGDGETERLALAERADREVERVRREAEQELARRLAAARDELQRAAADLTASAAGDLLARQITEEDRRRLLEQSVARLGEKA